MEERRKEFEILIRTDQMTETCMNLRKTHMIDTKNDYAIDMLYFLDILLENKIVISKINYIDETKEDTVTYTGRCEESEDDCEENAQAERKKLSISKYILWAAITRIGRHFITDYKYRVLLKKLYNKGIERNKEQVNEYISSIFKIVEKEKLLYDPAYGIEEREEYPVYIVYPGEKQEYFRVPVYIYRIFVYNRNSQSDQDIQNMLKRRIAYTKRDIYYRILCSTKDCTALREVCDLLNISEIYSLEEIYRNPSKKKDKISLYLYRFYRISQSIRESKRIIDRYNRDLLTAKKRIEVETSYRTLQMLLSIEAHKASVEKERETYYYIAKTIDYIAEDILAFDEKRVPWKVEVCLCPVSFSRFTQYNTELVEVSESTMAEIRRRIEKHKYASECIKKRSDHLKKESEKTQNRKILSQKTRKSKEIEIEIEMLDRKQEIIAEVIEKYVDLLSKELEKKRFNVYAKYKLEYNIAKLTSYQIMYIICSIKARYNRLVYGLEIKTMQEPCTSGTSNNCLFINYIRNKIDTFDEFDISNEVDRIMDYNNNNHKNDKGIGIGIDEDANPNNEDEIEDIAHDTSENDMGASSADGSMNNIDNIDNMDNMDGINNDRPNNSNDNLNRSPNPHKDDNSNPNDDDNLNLNDEIEDIIKSIIYEYNDNPNNLNANDDNPNNLNNNEIDEIDEIPLIPYAQTHTKEPCTSHTVIDLIENSAPCDYAQHSTLVQVYNPTDYLKIDQIESMIEITPEEEPNISTETDEPIDASLLKHISPVYTTMHSSTNCSSTSTSSEDIPFLSNTSSKTVIFFHGKKKTPSKRKTYLLWIAIVFIISLLFLCYSLYLNAFCPIPAKNTHFTLAYFFNPNCSSHI